MYLKKPSIVTHEVKMWQYALRVFREELHWSREQLARHIGVSTRSVVYWEQGNEPGLRAQAKLVMALQELPLEMERKTKEFYSRFFPESNFLTFEETIRIIENKGLSKRIIDVLAKDLPEIEGLSLREALSAYAQKKPAIMDGYMQNREAEQYMKLQKVYTSLKGQKKNPGTSFTKRKAPEQRKPVAGKRKTGRSSRSKDPGGGDDDGGSNSDDGPPEKVFEDVWLDIVQLARYVRIKESTLYSWAEKKFLPAYKLGKLWRFNKGEIKAWLREQRMVREDSPAFIDNLTRDLRKAGPGDRVNHKEVGHESL